MSENKRFILDEYLGLGSVIIDTENENIRFKHENKLSMVQCCDLLNELHNENKRLKSDKTNLHRTMSRDRVKYCQFKDKVFYCIDKKIKLFKDCCMSNEVRILEDLKKEMDI